VFNQLETQSGLKIKMVRTDNGTEYVNSTMTTYFKSKGIVRQTTVPYSPQQNGKAHMLWQSRLCQHCSSLLHDCAVEALCLAILLW